MSQPDERLAHEEWLVPSKPARGMSLPMGFAQDPVLTKANWSRPPLLRVCTADATAMPKQGQVTCTHACRGDP